MAFSLCYLGMSLPFKLWVKPDTKYLDLCRGELLNVPYLDRSLEVMLLSCSSEINKLVFIRYKFYLMSLGLV